MGINVYTWACQVLSTCLPKGHRVYGTQRRGTIGPTISSQCQGEVLGGVREQFNRRKQFIVYRKSDPATAGVPYRRSAFGVTRFYCGAHHGNLIQGWIIYLMS